MSRFIKSAALIAALALAAPIALADQPSPKAPAVTVMYGDLNLDTSKGVETLLSRISRASHKVCGQRPATTMNGVLDRYLDCRDTVVGETVSRIGNPAVSLAWAQQQGRSIQTASR